MTSRPSNLDVGDTITADWLNSVLDWIDSQSVSVSRDTGLTLKPSQTGRVLGVEGLCIARTFVVTTAITAGNGADTPGVGAGTMQCFDIVTKKYVSMNITGVALYSDAGIGIKAGSYAQFIKKDGQWFYDVTACANGAS